MRLLSVPYVSGPGVFHIRAVVRPCSCRNEAQCYYLLAVLPAAYRPVLAFTLCCSLHRCMHSMWSPAVLGASHRLLADVLV